MRTLLFVLALSSSSVFSQIPNAGFEEWVAGNWLLEPQGWSTANNQLFAIVTQDVDAYEGEFAMRVEAMPDGIGEYGWAECSAPIDYIPASLDFYAKVGAEFGGVSVSISFYNGEALFNSFDWNSGEDIDNWSLISIPLVQNEPVLTHAVIRIEAIVGDLVAGDAWISVDAMGFGEPLNSNDQDKAAFNAYPNPTNDVLNIEGIQSKSRLRLISMVGTVVIDAEINTPFSSLDIADKRPGLYILSIENAQGQFFSQKIHIQ